LWLSFLVYFIALMVVGEIHELFSALLSVAYMVNLSRRGNFLYYNRITKRNQLVVSLASADPCRLSRVRSIPNQGDLYLSFESKRTRTSFNR
jgi:hypothetical protein